MDRLKRLKLYGDGLITVDDPTLVARYNATLQDLGIEPTSLTSFHVDGMGWSPEIAAEKGDRYYLSHGGANPLGIIISPDQDRKPVYSPFTSYDRSLMERYSKKNAGPIADITRNACIGLDMDLKLTRFNSPADFLLMRFVTVRSSAGAFTADAQRQKDLVSKFRDDEQAWFDVDLRTEIMESARAHGDLRYRRLEIPEMRFNEVQTFSTILFGGVFVIRWPNWDDAMILVQDISLLSSLTGRCAAYHIHDDCLVRRLYDLHLVDVDLPWYQTHGEELRRKAEAVQANALCRREPDLDFGKLTQPQRHRKTSQLDGPDGELLDELERLICRLDAGGTTDPSILSDRLFLLLLHPHDHVEGLARKAIWQLLCRWESRDLLRLYIVDKERFFSEYQGWPDSLKRYAEEWISAEYVPYMHHKPETVPHTPKGGVL